VGPRPPATAARRSTVTRQLTLRRAAPSIPRGDPIGCPPPLPPAAERGASPLRTAATRQVPGGGAPASLPPASRPTCHPTRPANGPARPHRDQDNSPCRTPQLRSRRPTPTSRRSAPRRSTNKGRLRQHLPTHPTSSTPVTTDTSRWRPDRPHGAQHRTVSYRSPAAVQPALPTARHDLRRQAPWHAANAPQTPKGDRQHLPFPITSTSGATPAPLTPPHRHQARHGPQPTLSTPPQLVQHDHRIRPRTAPSGQHTPSPDGAAVARQLLQHAHPTTTSGTPHAPDERRHHAPPPSPQHTRTRSPDLASAQLPSNRRQHIPSPGRRGRRHATPPAHPPDDHLRHATHPDERRRHTPTPAPPHSSGTPAHSHQTWPPHSSPATGDSTHPAPDDAAVATQLLQHTRPTTRPGTPHRPQRATTPHPNPAASDFSSTPPLDQAPAPLPAADDIAPSAAAARPVALRPRRTPQVPRGRCRPQVRGVLGATPRATRSSELALARGGKRFEVMFVRLARLLNAPARGDPDSLRRRDGAVVRQPGACRVAGEGGGAVRPRTAR
jgi:hypothetical protein